MAKKTETGQVLTPEGKEKLEAELHHLEHVKRKEVGERIKVAREFGDISENSEFDDAKNELAFVEARIADIKQILATATLVKSQKRSTSKANIGAMVTLVSDSGKERVIQLVGAAESDSSNGKISNECPMGAAVLGHRKGDVIEFEGPTGRKLKYTIAKVGK